jgi:DNA-binding response OmpR family regulator
MASILLVEDSPLIQEMVRSLLEESGHQVEVAAKIMPAVRLIKSARFDLILMDLNLPDFRGEDAIRGLRHHMKVDTPIIVLSGEIKIDTIVSLRPLGVAGFVAKSDDFEPRLLEELAKVLKGDSHLPESP